MVCLTVLHVAIFVVAFSELQEKVSATSQVVESEIAIRKFKKNVDDFESNFDENFKKLQEFIRANLSLADTLDVKYLLFTPENRHLPYELNATENSLKESKFNPNLGVKFVVHGYGVKLTFPNDVFFVIKDKLLQQDDYNVFVLNYTKYTSEEFSTSVKYSYLVSRNIANLIQFLMAKTGIKSEKFHLIGHSLGGDVVGNVGNLIPNIGRITGLDPGAPLFQHFPPNYRINENSAKFVDVIHTSASRTFPDGLGLAFPVGHQDFFVSGGNDQPGCKYGETWIDENLSPETIMSKLSLLKCNHIRSEFLFAASISNCKFLGVRCDSYEDFNSGRCNKDNSIVAQMGFPAKEIPGLPSKTKFYLNTSSKYPFCNQ